MKAVVYVGIMIMIHLTGCKNAPTFIADNERDPTAFNFRPESPKEVEIIPSHDSDALFLKWVQEAEATRYISGYKVYKSVTDTLNFSNVSDIDKNDIYESRNGHYYSYKDEIGNNGIIVTYKIEAYYIQENDTSFSEPVYLSYNGEFSIEAKLRPFSSQPSLDLTWEYNHISPEANIEFFSRKPDSEDYEILGSQSIQQGYANIVYNVDLPKETELFYRFSLDSISSNMEKFEYNVSIPVLEISKSSEQTADNSVAIEIKFSTEFTDYNANMDYFTVSLYESNNPIEITALGEADTILTYRTTLQFNPPTTSSLLNNLNSSKYYMVTVSGSRGSFSTHEEFKYLTFDLINTSSEIFNTNINEDSYFQGSFRSNVNKIIYSFDLSTAGVINIDNGQVEHKFALEPRNNEIINISTNIANFGGKQDAIITSTSSDKVQVWDPDTYNLTKNIPNYSGTSVDTSPWDIAVISDNKLLVAYLPENYETKRAIFISVWDHSKEEHELIYEINHDIIYPESVKLIYNRDHNLFHILYNYLDQEDYDNGEVPKQYLLSIDSINFELINSTEIMRMGTYSNMTLDDNGNYLYIFDGGAYMQFDVMNFKQNHTSYFRFLKNLISAKDADFKCIGGNPTSGARIECYNTYFNSSLLFEHNSDKYLLGLTVNNSGSKLVALYPNAIQIFSFSKGWRLER